MKNQMDSLVLRADRRAALRRPLVLSVEVGGSSSVTQLCKAGNVSLSGMFLHCAPAFGRADEIVRLEFRLCFGGVSKRCRMMVKIVRVADDGFGICFHKFDAVTFRYVRKMMYECAAV